jgi:hypothetical protein
MASRTWLHPCVGAHVRGGACLARLAAEKKKKELEKREIFLDVQRRGFNLCYRWRATKHMALLAQPGKSSDP